MNKCPYNKCDGSGLIPLKNKAGEIVPYAWTHCDCHPVYGINPEPQHYREPQLDDYDYPLSDSFRAWTYEHCGIPDPGYAPSREKIQRQQVKPMTKPAQDEIQKLKAEINHLQNEIIKLKANSKSAQKPQVRKGGIQV